MTTEIKLPQFGMGMSEATVVRWHKSAGEQVTEGEPLIEVESAKSLNEVVAPASGVLRAIHIPADEIAQVYDVLGVIGGADVPAADVAPIPVSATPGREASKVDPAGETLASPRARRLARELGVDLRSLTGTGPGGRINDEDVTRAAASTRDKPIDSETSEDEAQPLSGMRALIAKHVFQSLQQSAQLTLTRSVDVSAMVAMRDFLKNEVSAGYNDVVVKAAALALREHRALNATCTGEGVTHHSDIDIGIAVAVKEGLVVPIVRRADQQPLSTLAAEIRRLGGLARANRLPTADLRGGSFSVSNLGPYEIDAFTPIINMPQVAILGVGKIAECYVKHSGAAVWRHQMTVSLTFDHRVIDGAPAAEFLRSFASVCGQPADLID